MLRFVIVAEGKSYRWLLPLTPLCQILAQQHVSFVVNAPYSAILDRLSTSSIGLSTMVDEHFGINVVEFMVRADGMSNAAAAEALSLRPLDSSHSPTHLPGHCSTLLSLPPASRRVRVNDNVVAIEHFLTFTNTRRFPRNNSG